MKVSRNDPCPCGSGKKYKHCCLGNSVVEARDPRLLAWKRVRRVLEGYADRMMRFVRETYEGHALREAWEEFTLGGGEKFSPDTPHTQVFIPWLFHHWKPVAGETAVSDPALHVVPPTQIFLDRSGRNVDPLLRRYLEACIDAPFSFYEVASCEPGKGFEAVDIFAGIKRDVFEASASQTFRDGDVFYGLLATVDGVTILEATTTHVIPPIDKIEIVRLRAWLASRRQLPMDQKIRRYTQELRRLYLQLIDHIVNPRRPRLTNTDGHDLVVQRLVFDIESTQATFDALKHLDTGSTEAELLGSAVRDADCTLQRVTFSWIKRGNKKHKGMRNTVLGEVKIDGRRMHVEVNSKERAAAFRRLVTKALGSRARFRIAEVQSADKLMAQARKTGGASDAARDAERDELMREPEVQAKLAQMMAQHYEHWVDEPIPALGGVTPMQAVKSRDGREMVEALVRQIERGASNVHVEANVVRRLRQRLGLRGE